MKQIQIWVGHNTLSSTADIYIHFDYSAHLESAKAMNDIFTKTTETAPDEA